MANDKRQAKIDDGVPIPEVGVKRSCSREWGKMKVGQSFLSSEEKWSSDYRSASSWGKRHGGEKFAVRKRTMEKDGEEGRRIWRVA